jgi:AcrR family transcriptional regulator
VVATAVALADEHGIDFLSMRNLAEELGVVPMALYKHVASKEKLVDAMVDLVFSETDFSTEADWKTALRGRAVVMRQALLRHPWAVGRMESGTPGPANLRHHNAVMGCLRAKAGLSFRAAVHAYSLMDSYLYGFALQEKALTGDIPAEAERRTEVIVEEHPSPLEAYPYLMDVADQLANSGYDFAEEFEFGLDLVLDAIGRFRQAELSSSTAHRRRAR